MLRRSRFFLQLASSETPADLALETGTGHKFPKQRGFYRGGRILNEAATVVRYREVRESGNESIVAKGVRVHQAATGLREELAKMENPMVWIWFPWRRNPEAPLPSFPCPNALKNLNGAFIPEISDAHQKSRAKALAAENRRAYRGVDLDAKFASSHPFLNRILNETRGQKKGFPFWFKKYPTRRFATETRFNVPEEMLEDMPAEIQRGLSPQNMSESELIDREKRIYRERYATHELEEHNPAMAAVSCAIRVRELRNHILSNPKNNIAKFWLASAERSLRRQLRSIRRNDFRKYWEIIRDHDMMDIMQPSSQLDLRKGLYWAHDWENGNAIATNLGDFMDPRGMSGCIETGRSRAEVARDLGLSYTRPLTPGEKKTLTSRRLYFERLRRFKTELPDAFIERERQQFIAKFTGIYCRATARNATPDFPQYHRHLIGGKVLRWKSTRHGPY